MKTLTATVTGEEESDLRLAMEEVIRLVDGVFTSGQGRNETGSYSFNITEGPPIPPGALPEILEDHVEEMWQLVEEGMVQKGDKITDCQKIAMRDALEQLRRTIVGIQPQDLKNPCTNTPT